jgi:hypothetical protein
MNFGLHFQKGLLSSKNVLQKMTRTKDVEQLEVSKLGSVHFFVPNSPKEATDVARKGPKFP